MADNIALATGSGGATVAADELILNSATVSVQLIKFGYGTEGVYQETGTGFPYPVVLENTRYAADAAAVGTDSGLVFLAVRKDTLTEATQADGDYVQPRTASNGALWVKVASGSLAIDTWSATGAVNVATDLTYPVAVATEVKLATGNTIDVAVATEIKLATDNVIDVSAATTATQAVAVQNTATVVVTSGDITASQSTHDSLNANANLQISDADVAAGNPVWVRIAASGTATQAVDVSKWSATDLNVNLAQTATVAITGSVAVATTATHAVEVQNTATVAITGTVPVSVATEVIVTQDTATDLNVTVATDNVIDVSVATTATQPVLIQNGATDAIIIQPFNYRAAGTQIFTSVSATTLATLATGVTNTYRDLVWMTMNNNATTEAQIRIRDTSTATWNNFDLAPDGGGISFTPVRPAEQSAAAGAWDVQLESEIDGQVYIAAQFLDVT